MQVLRVASHRGAYRVRFAPLFHGLDSGLRAGEHLLIDSEVARLYSRPLRQALAGRSVLRIDAKESNKSIEALPRFARQLIERGFRRDHILVAVGGGVVLELAAFLAGTLLRGVRWRCYPTTLLAQADACIGGKSSLNVGPYKNQLGTVTAPQEAVVCVDALATLPETELRSGLGEVLKAHVLSGWPAFRALARDFQRLPGDRALLQKAVLRSLRVKRGLVEADEFDRGKRMLLNYGHTFGHAIESASGYSIPHGIAVTLGMDMANRYSRRRGLAARSTVEEIGALLRANLRGFRPRLPLAAFLDAFRRDKKERGGEPRLVLLREPGRLLVREIPFDEGLRSFCREYFKRMELYGGCA